MTKTGGEAKINVCVSPYMYIALKYIVFYNFVTCTQRTPLLCLLEEIRLPELDMETFPLSMEDVDTAYCSKEEYELEVWRDILSLSGRPSVPAPSEWAELGLSTDGGLCELFVCVCVCVCVEREREE